MPGLLISSDSGSGVLHKLLIKMDSNALMMTSSLRYMDRYMPGLLRPHIVGPVLSQAAADMVRFAELALHEQFETAARLVTSELADLER